VPRFVAAPESLTTTDRTRIVGVLSDEGELKSLISATVYVPGETLLIEKLPSGSVNAMYEVPTTPTSFFNGIEG
jgi:hypothetical protein